MFKKEYGNVTIEVADGVPKRGTCLCASAGESRLKIYMDICGMMIADGSNAYMFGNKLIVVTRWQSMSDDEISTVKEEDIRFVFAPFDFVQLAVDIGGYGWSDVFFNLYHCGIFPNDENKPVDQIIMIFADKATGEIVADRAVTLPASMGEFLRECMVRSHKKAFFDLNKGDFAAAAQQDAQRDFCDVVYDYLWGFTKETSRKFRGFSDLENVHYGIYLVADKDGNTKDLYQCRND